MNCFAVYGVQSVVAADLGNETFSCLLKKNDMFNGVCLQHPKKINH